MELVMYIVEVIYKIPCPWVFLVGREAKILSCRPWGEKGSRVMIRFGRSIDSESLKKRGVIVSSIYRMRDGHSIAFIRSKACPCRISGLNEAHILSSKIDTGYIRMRIACESLSEAREIISRMRQTGIEIYRYRWRRINNEDFLTARQEEALIMSFIKGFFDSPRRIDLDKLSKDLGVAKPTAYLMIKRAIRKLIKQTLYLY